MELLYHCRIHGSYEALEGGWTQDALVDFTGGLGMSVDLTQKDKLQKDMFDVMLRQQRNNALLGCSIRVSYNCVLACLIYIL